MSLIVSIAVAVWLLDGVWRWLLIGGAVLFEGAELWLWTRIRGRPAATGTETMVGASGTAVTDVAPTGQVRVRGQIWSATAQDRIRAGDPVRVVQVDGLRLTVCPAADHN